MTSSVAEAAIISRDISAGSFIGSGPCLSPRRRGRNGELFHVRTTMKTTCVSYLMGYLRSKC